MATETLVSVTHTRTAWLNALQLALLSFILTLFCLELIVVSGHIAPLWLSTPLMTIVVFRNPPRSLPLLLAGCVLGVSCANALLLGPAFSNIKFPLINLAQALFGGLLLRRLLDAESPLSSLFDWAKLVFGAVLLAPMFGAVLASWVLHITPHGSPHYFISWVVSEVIGMLAIGPVGLLWQRSTVKRLLAERGLEIVLTGLATLALVWLALRYIPWPFTMLVVILFYSAVRLPRLAAFSVFLLAIALVTLILTFELAGHNSPNSQLLKITPWIPFLLALIPAHLMTLVMHAFRADRTRIVESEARFRHAMEFSAIGMALVSPAGQWLQVNRSLCLLLGYSEAELKQMTFQQLTHSDDLHADVAQAHALLAGEVQSYSHEKRYYRRDGELVWALLAVSLVRDEQGTPLYFISQIEDITAMKQTADENQRLMARLTQANEALYQEKERMHITLDTIDEAVIGTDREMRVNFMNPVAEEMSGWLQQQAAGKPLAEILRITRGSHGEELENLLQSGLPLAVTPRVENDLVLHSRSHAQFAIHYSFSPLTTQLGDSIGSVMVIRDVSESREMIRRLSYSASHDMLTRLPNRVSFEQQLSELLEENGDRPARHVLAFIDLDRFKAVNDSAGHAAGDALLRELAIVMRLQLRTRDLLARLGGDEFGVLLPECELATAIGIIERLVAAVKAHRFHWQNHPHQVGASAGLTRLDPGFTASEAMVQADIACYNAKHNGRGQLSVWQYL